MKDLNLLVRIATAERAAKENCWNKEAMENAERIVQEMLNEYSNGGNLCVIKDVSDLAEAVFQERRLKSDLDKIIQKYEFNMTLKQLNVWFKPWNLIPDELKR